MHKNVLKYIPLLLMMIFLSSSCANFKTSSRDYTKNRGKSTYSKSRSSSTKTATSRRTTSTKSRSTASKTTTSRPISSSTRTTISSSNTKSNLRSKVVKNAYHFIGTKYKYGGKDPSGFDCSGFTSYVMKKENIQIKDGSYNQAKQGRKIALTSTKPGDLVFFGTNGRVSHVGMVVENSGDRLNVIHSTSTKGVIVQNIKASDYWKKRVLFARNIIED